MEFGIKNQLLFLVAAAVAGFLLSFFYDVIRAKRRIKPTGAALINFEDIIFIVFSGALLLYVAYKYNGGSLRAAGFILPFFSGALYFFILKNRVVDVICAVFKLIFKIIRICFKFVFFPLKILLRSLKKPVCVVVWHTGNVFFGIKQKIKCFVFVAKHRLKREILFLKRKF